MAHIETIFQEEEQNQNTDQNIYPAIDKPPGYDSISQPVTTPPQPSAPVEVPIQAAYAPGSEPIQTQPSATTNLLPQSTGRSCKLNDLTFVSYFEQF